MRLLRRSNYTYIRILDILNNFSVSYYSWKRKFKLRVLNIFFLGNTASKCCGWDSNLGNMTPDTNNLSYDGGKPRVQIVDTEFKSFISFSLG